MTKGWVGVLAGAAGLSAGLWFGWQARGVWQQVSPWAGTVPVARESDASTGAGVPPAVDATAAPPAGVGQEPPSNAATRDPAPTSGGYVELAPSAPGGGGVPAPEEAVRDLRARELRVPVAGVPPRGLAPSFDQARGQRTHEAIDIMAPRGTPVVAVEDGTVAKLFTSQYGGLTIYQFDPTARYAYYYAHLDRYAPGLAEGQTVQRGQTLGFVGSTGNASPSAPHLHFGIFILTPERRWWQGTPIDPYPIWR